VHAKIAFVFALLILICSPLLLAEEFFIQVLDPSEAAVPGAAVEIQSSTQSGKTISTAADGQGHVAVAMQLPVTIHVKAPGFEALIQKIDASPSGQIKLHLRPAIINTSIEVMVKEDLASEGSIERSALVIDRSGARTVYDAVDKLIPSAYVPSRGILGHGLGTSNSISLRGLGGSPTTQLLVVIDGRPEVMGLMGHPIPDFYSLTDVGSLSITSGPASVLYVTHDFNLIPKCMHCAVFMNHGRIVFDGAVEEALTGSMLSRLFEYPLEVFERNGRRFVSLG
jgi:hypothetical protein